MLRAQDVQAQEKRRWRLSALRGRNYQDSASGVQSDVLEKMTSGSLDHLFI
jgi:hypothetical protein